MRHMLDQYFTVSLRIWHPTLSGDAITGALCLTPEVSHSVGTQRTTPFGDPLEGLYRCTYWSFPLVEKTPGVFTDGLSELLRSIERYRGFFAQTALDGGRTELFVGVFKEGSVGFTLEPHVMIELANLSLELSVDIY